MFTSSQTRQAFASDSALLERFRRGDDDAATELYVKYAARLHRVATAKTSTHLRRRLEADDVVQSVFRTFFRRVSEGFFDVPPGDEIWGLFLVLALNKIRRSASFHRRKKRDLRLTVSIERSTDLIQATDAAPLTTLQITIDELLEQLTPLQRKMVEMRIQGSSLEDISAEIERSTRTVERVLKQFRNNLSSQVNDA